LRCVTDGAGGTKTVKRLIPHRNPLIVEVSHPTGWRRPATVGEGCYPMTVQIPAARQDDLAIHLATRIEARLDGLANELEHADVVVYDADRGFATRGAVIRMTVADLAAVVAEVVLRGVSDGPLSGLHPGPA
jgi:hypothetical protein